MCLCKSKVFSVVVMTKNIQYFLVQKFFCTDEQKERKKKRTNESCNKVFSFLASLQWFALDNMASSRILTVIFVCFVNSASEKCPEIWHEGVFSSGYCCLSKCTQSDFVSRTCCIMDFTYQSQYTEFGFSLKSVSKQIYCRSSRSTWSSRRSLCASCLVDREGFLLFSLLNRRPTLLHTSLSLNANQATHCHMISLRFGVSSLTPYLAGLKLSDVSSLTRYLTCQRVSNVSSVT